MDSVTTQVGTRKGGMPGKAIPTADHSLGSILMGGGSEGSQGKPRGDA